MKDWRHRRSTVTIVAVILAAAFSTRGAESDEQQQFELTIRPVLQKYCLGCHSTEKQKGDLDLERFSTLREIDKHPSVWQDVAEHLADNEMPPKEKPQPSPEKKTQLETWVHAQLGRMALAHAGDPGPVVLRRLSNAEYTYTVRDLTGVASLDPAREFPADSAAGEGFANAGQAMVMSPALLTKYLAAGRDVARHAVFLPDGLRFSEKTTRRDWTEEILTQIRAFYADFSESRGATTVNLQGLQFQTNGGGRLPLERYFAATLEERASLDSGAKSIEAVAAERKLSPKYLGLLWTALHAEQPSLLLDALRARWRDAAPHEAKALAEQVEAWQAALWKFNSVGQIGKRGGAKSWQEAVTPIATTQEIRVKMPKTPAGRLVRLYLSVNPVGEKAAPGFVIWERPRFTASGRPEVLLRDASQEGAFFGDQPGGPATDSADLATQTNSISAFAVPSEMVEGCEFVTTVHILNAGSCVQARATFAPWDGDPSVLSLSSPIFTGGGEATKQQLVAGFDEFRALFPAALCYSKIVPVDEVITLLLYYREDEPLMRLMLDDAHAAKLDRLWSELHFVSGDALLMVDVFEQLWQYATQDADPTVLEPLRNPVNTGAAAYRQQLLESEPRQLGAVLDFAARAYRRPLTEREKADLRALYQTLRSQETPHDEALRLTLARVFLAPPFLYRAETAHPGAQQTPVTDLELATRLSYFLWSSAPDAELRACAEAGKLHQTDELLRQTRRLLRDDRIRRLAVEFGCAWLHIHDFDELNEKSERQFPTFAELRGPMYEEAIRFFTELFQNNRPVSDLLDADYTFLNEPLARHYGVPGISGPDWRRVDGVKQYARGGILALGATLTKQSGASRTSPILRGSWVAETLLGDHLPKPPKDVPRLPEEETADTLTVRQLTEKHTSDPRCAGCHARFDFFGFALENFDAIGRWRDRDSGNRAIDAQSQTPEGAELSGYNGLRHYLASTRRDAFLHQFCRKLLGYALGRSVQLSDEPLLQQIQNHLAADDHLGGIVENIVVSRQFRDLRGREFVSEEE